MWRMAEVPQRRQRSLYWTNNLASLNIGPNGSFDVRDGQPMNVDALTGSGSWMPTTLPNNVPLTIGDNNGSGTWSGQITSNT